MKICPVCKTPLSSGCVCPVCGYDISADFTEHRSLAPPTEAERELLITKRKLAALTHIFIHAPKANVSCTYKDNDSGITITGYRGKLPADMILPREIDGKKVTGIGGSVFAFCGSLTSVTVPNSVTNIGSSAFFRCYNLTSVTISEGVTHIGYSAFCDCDRLTSVTIPDSVTRIDNGAFDGCNSLTSVTVPANCEVGEYAFPSTCTVIRR